MSTHIRSSTSLPSSPLNHKPRHIIEYAKTQRQACLKYLAILRWKSSVDAPVASSSTNPNAGAITNGHSASAAGFPTPQTNGGYTESTDTSPAAGYPGKGKARAGDTNEQSGKALARGKVTDAKRVAHFMEHQNRQHEDAIAHVKHITTMIETLRERNPDLLTSISLLNNGTYTRLPSDLVEPFKPQPPLTNRVILRTLRRLSRHLLYRLRCVDHLPPDLVVKGVRDGKVYVEHGGEYGWKAEMTTVGFGEGDDGRWWLTGVEWGWRTGQKGSEEPMRVQKLSQEERTRIIEIVNSQVLMPKPVPKSKAKLNLDKPVVDAPLIRLYNFLRESSSAATCQKQELTLEHLSLSYQLETLFSQAFEISGGKWRNHLLVEMDRQAEVLKARYWNRPRPAPSTTQTASSSKRPAPTTSLGAPRTPLIGGIISIKLEETQRSEGGIQDIMQHINSGSTEPSERALNLHLNVKWEVGEIGAGGGLKAGDAMDARVLDIVSGLCRQIGHESTVLNCRTPDTSASTTSCRSPRERTQLTSPASSLPHSSLPRASPFSR